MKITTKRKADGALTVKLNGKRMGLDVAARIAIAESHGEEITIANEHGVSYNYYGHCNRSYDTEAERKLVRQTLKDAIRNFADYR